MTHGEACQVRACVSCGAPGAWLCKTTAGENPGRLLRLCANCLRGADDWHRFGLVDREPLPLETEICDGACGSKPAVPHYHGGPSTDDINANLEAK